MKCPKCNSEMEAGMIQSGKMIIWTNKKHLVSINPRKNDVVLADNPVGGATVPAYICRDCELVVIQYRDAN